MWAVDVLCICCVLGPMVISTICAVPHMKLWWKWWRTVQRFALTLTISGHPKAVLLFIWAAWKLRIRGRTRRQFNILRCVYKISGKLRRNVVTSVCMRNWDMPSDAEESLNERAEYFTEILYDTTTTSGAPPTLPTSTDIDISVEDFADSDVKKLERDTISGTLILVLLGRIAPLQVILYIATHFCIAWSVCLWSVCLSHLCHCPLLKLADGFRCHLAGTFVWFYDTLCYMTPLPEGRFGGQTPTLQTKHAIANCCCHLGNEI